MRNSKNLFLVMFSLVVCALLTGCLDSAPSGTYVKEGDYYYGNNDAKLDEATAKKVILKLMEAAPEISTTLRKKLEAAHGTKFKVNLRLNSQPVPQSRDVYEARYYSIYALFNSDDKGTITRTFLVSSDLSEIKGYDEEGEKVIPIDQWRSENK